VTREDSSYEEPVKVIKFDQLDAVDAGGVPHHGQPSLQYRSWQKANFK